MGKDSLLKSTSPTKGSAKKKGGAKTTAPKNPANDRTARPQGKNPGNDSPAGKAPVGKSAAAAEKNSPPKQPTVRELLALKFDRYAPERLYAPEPENIDPERLASPPFIAAEDPRETERLKSLLLEKFDLAAMAEAAGKQTPEPAPPPPRESVPGEIPALESAAGETVTVEGNAAETPPSGEMPFVEGATETLPSGEMPPVVSATEKEAPPGPEAAPRAATAEPTPPPGTGASQPPPAGPPGPDVLQGYGGPAPFSKTTILGIVAFAMLVLLIVGASYSNTMKFYLQTENGALEIWQGVFAPMGEKKLVTLPGMTAPSPTQEVYTRAEVFPLAFEYYVSRADALLEAPGLPDFEAIKANLQHARRYAVSPELERLARIRIDYIDLFILRYKAEVMAARGSQEGLDAAIGYLEQAENLAVEADEAEEIAKRIETFQGLKTQLAEAAAAAEAERTAAETAISVEPPATEAPQEGAVAPVEPEPAEKPGQ